ncbi:hypothetical protein BC943DRAFT_362186 [Umbelopsis sp. AD052]|nr:hypothetical protein BC943DRAFT_362186 [Umbelopsis sp. AD052]
MASAEVEVPTNFANNFWGSNDAGTEILRARMLSSKQTNEDLKAFYNTKAALHEDFGKKLLKHSKMVIGKDETGTLRRLLDGIRDELEGVGQHNITLAQRIRNSLETPLQNFITDQRDQRKLIQVGVDKQQRNKQLHINHVYKSREKYYAECSKMLNLQNQLETCIAGREYERIKQKHEKSRLEVKTSDKEYQAACTGLKNVMRQWQNEWKVACDKFQEMEEKRIEFLHHSLCVYVNILQTVTDQERESHEQIWDLLDHCDVEQDIQHFIEAQGTGNHIPEPPSYVDFFSETRDEPPKYSIANFAGRQNSKRLSTSAIPNSKSDQELKRASTQSLQSITQPLQRASSTRLSSSIERESRQLSNAGDEEIFIEDSAQGVLVPIVTKKTSSQIQSLESSRVQSLESSRVMNQASDDVFHTTERAKIHEYSDGESNATPSQSHPKQSFVTRLSRKLSQNLDRSFDHALEGLIYKMEKGRDVNDVEYSPTKTSARSNSYRRAPSPVKNTSSSSAASKNGRPISPYLPGGWPNNEPKVSLSTSAKIISERSGVIQSPSPSYSTGTAIGAKTSSVRDPRGSIKMNAPPSMRRSVVQQQSLLPQPPPSQEKQVASHDGGEPIICWAIALFNYHAKYDDDLTFERGDWFAITQMDQGGWYMAHAWNATDARWVGKYGYVPSNFLQPAK